MGGNRHVGYLYSILIRLILDDDEDIIEVSYLGIIDYNASIGYGSICL